MATPTHANVVAVHDPPSSAQKGQPLNLTVFVYDNDVRNAGTNLVSYSVNVIYRDGGGTTKVVTVFVHAAAGIAQPTIPGSDITGQIFSYYIEVYEDRTVCGVRGCGTLYSSTRLPDTGTYDVQVTP
jgi:hypothetical protein